jgi:Tfp pilus assembly protein PilF
MRALVAAALFFIVVCAAHETRASKLAEGQRRAAGGGVAAERAEQEVAEGVAAIERGDEEAARAAFRRALAADAENVTAHTYLGVLADRAGDLKEAERHFAAAAMAAPFLAPARNNYGAILLRAGRTQLAAAQFEASLKLDRNQPSALVNLAQIRFKGGKPEDLRAARELFARADRIAPDAEIARALVVIALRLGEREAAANAYRDYAARLSSAAASSPISAPASRGELGTALLEGRLFDEAVRELGAAAEAEPSNVGFVVALARAHLGRRDIPSAGRTLEAAVARGLDAAPIYAALADVYEGGGYVENAIPAMRLALARDPKNESYHYRYGMLLTDTKAPAAATIRLQEALQEFPRSPRLWLALGVAQFVNGKNEDATRSLNRALELAPEFVPALAYLGAVHAERGQYATAVSFFERAIAADDKLAAPFYLAADSLLKQPEVDTARVEKYLARSVELDPNFPQARLALAKLYVRAERWTEAASQLENAVRLDPNLAEAHYQLGRVYARLRRTTEAQATMATFKKLSDAQREQKDNERRVLVRRLANVNF